MLNLLSGYAESSTGIVWVPLSEQTWEDEMGAISRQCEKGSTRGAHSVPLRLLAIWELLICVSILPFPFTVNLHFPERVYIIW